MRTRAISRSSYVRLAHEEKRATKSSLLETIGEPGECCPVQSFYETPAPWLAARADRDLFPVSRLVPNRTRQESEFAVRHGELSEEWLRSTAAGTGSLRTRLLYLSFLRASDRWSE